MINFKLSCKKMMDLISRKPILSICIPTYNRGEHLKSCLESIIIQDEFKTGLVEIVISDNASTDDTKKIVGKYMDEFDNIIYWRNEVNIRDKNFPLVLSLGNGILRRLSNDTLIYKPGSLKYMCEIIGKYKATRPYLFWGNGNVNEEEISVRNSFEKFVIGASFWITSIACFSIWENECKNIEKDIEGTELLLWQVRKCLKLSQEKNGAIILNKRIVEIQTVEKKNISYGLFKVFYINFFKLLEPYFSSNILKENDREVLERELLFDFFMDWSIQWELYNRSFEYSKEENLKFEIENQYKTKPYWRDYVKQYKRKKIRMVIVFYLRRIKQIIGYENEGRKNK